MTYKVLGAPLTDKEIAWNGELTADSESNRRALDLALLNFKNSETTLIKRRREFWDEVRKVRGFEGAHVTIKNIEGQVRLVEHDNED